MPDFTPSQLDAVDYRKLDACVVAGPGSGKTTVLVERYRRLVQDHGLHVDNILAITFTEKAAANMKSKLAEKFELNPDQRREVESAWVSTIHGFCARLLRQNAVAAGVDPRFIVLDERQADRLQHEGMSTAMNSLAVTRREDTLGLIEALQVPQLSGYLLDIYDGIRSAGLSVDDIRAMPSPGQPASIEDLERQMEWILASWPKPCTPTQLGSYRELVEWMSNVPHERSLLLIWNWLSDSPINLNRVPAKVKDGGLKKIKEDLIPRIIATAAEVEYADFREMILDALAHFDRLYRDRKATESALDFNDLERYTIQLLRANNEVQGQLREMFQQIMLDEFQDINDQQWELLNLLRGPETFFAVGDSNQSIYGFRHARPEIFREYQERSAAKHYTELIDNFRSRQEILSCVEHLLQSAAGIERRGLHAGRQFEPKKNPSIEILKALAEDRDDASELEGEWIAHRIHRMRQSPEQAVPEASRLKFSDFAVLVRTGDAMRPILQAFERAEIPYVSSRRDSFLLSREGLDITSLLHVISNPRDEVRLMTVLRSPLVSLSDEALLRMRDRSVPFADAMSGWRGARLDGEDEIRISRFLDNLRRWREEQLVLPLDRLLVRALADCGYAWSPENARGSRIESFLHLARTTGAGMSLAEFLLEIESLSEADDKEAELADDDQGDRVQVLTAHASKGLEFPVVFVAGMERDGRIGTGPANFTPQFGLGIRWRTPDGDRDGIKDSWHAANGEATKQREREEAHRLLYVAMTRAEQHLVLSYSNCSRYGEWAGLLEKHFGLKETRPMEAPRVSMHRNIDGNAYAVSIFVTDAAPPLLSLSEISAPTLESATLLRPALDGQSDSITTATALAVFSVCPRKYYLQRYIGTGGSRFEHTLSEEEISGNKEEEDFDSSAALLGTETHNLLAGIPGEYSPRARELAERFRRGDLGMLAGHATEVHREWDFICNVEETLVRGVIDLWFEDPVAGETIIVDYKTDDLSTDEVSGRAHQYAAQLALYAIALGRKPVRAYLHFVQPDVIVEVPLGHSALLQARALVRDLGEAQEQLHFPLREGEHCRRCAYWKGNPCPAGTQPRTNSELTEPSPESVLVSIAVPG